MINKRLNAIKIEEIEQNVLQVAQGKIAEVPQRLFHHSKKATKLLLSESDLNELKIEVHQDSKRCVIL